MFFVLHKIKTEEIKRDIEDELKVENASLVKGTKAFAKMLVTTQVNPIT